MSISTTVAPTTRPNAPMPSVNQIVRVPDPDDLGARCTA